MLEKFQINDSLLPSWDLESKNTTFCAKLTAYPHLKSSIEKIYDYKFLSTEIETQEEDPKKSLDFDDISEFHYYF